MEIVDQINETVNSVLEPLVANEGINSALKLFLVLFGGLAAPRIPVKYGPFFANSYFRVAFMFLIMWTTGHDPVLAVLLAGGYFLLMHYIVKNSLQQVQRTGVVSPEVSIVISGGGGPNIKPGSVVNAEARLMQSSVNSSKSTGFVKVPEAVVSGPPSTASNAGIPNLPSGNPADNPSMMASSPSGGEPRGIIPDDVADLAFIPK